MLTQIQTQQLDGLLQTVNELTADSMATWHQALAEEVHAAAAEIERVTVASRQGSLVQQMAENLGQQQQAILDTLELPLRSLQILIDSGHLSNSQKVQLLIQLGQTRYLLTQWDIALDLFYRGLDYCQGNLPQKADILNFIGRIKTRQEDYAEANRWYRASLAIHSELGDNYQVAQLHINLGWNDFQTENYTVAEANYRRALQIAQASEGAERLIADGHMSLAVLATVRGDFETAIPYYSQCVQIYDSIEDIRGMAYAHYNLGLLHVDMQAWKKAGESYQMSLEYAKAGNNLHLVGLVHLSYTELALKLSDFSLAQACCMHAVKTFSRLGNQAQLSEAYKYAGQIQYHRRAWGKAATFFEKGISLASSCGARLNEAEARYEYGLMLIDKSDLDGARTQLNEAKHLFVALGAKADIQKTRTALAQLAEDRPDAASGSRFKRIQR